MIAGQWRPAPVIPGRWNTDPNTGEPVHPMATTAPADVERALAAADALHRDGTWQDVSSPERAALLDRVADALADRVEEIAVTDSLTSGVPIATTRIVAGFIPARFRAAAQDCLANPRTLRLPAGGRDVRLLRLPWGPAAVLTPWNAPSFIAASKVASALAAGCPVLFKPSEYAAATARPLAEAVAGVIEGAGLPAAAFQVLHGAGDVGAALTGDPRVKVVCFTGGQAAGRSIARAAAEHFTLLQLELGGNNPVLVLRDADVPATAASLARGMILLNGQWCEGPGKVLVHRDLAADLVDALGAELAQVRIGHSLDAGTTLGPLAHHAHRDLVRDRIEELRDRGAGIVRPVAAPDGDGCFLAPELAVGADPGDATDELFGPAVSVHAVDSDDDALRLANAHPSGLDAYVYGTDLDHALRIGERVACGEVRINGAHLADLGDGSAQGFWGGSGIGGHGPAESVRVFSGDRVVGVDSDDLVI
ncbi:dehydrogenase [Pseudonocardia sp. CNS-004]|nr:dehydrogenase [Pseudonocardia sp. CNS-004]